MAGSEVERNGWTAVPVDAGSIFKDKPYINEPTPLREHEIEFPSDDPIVSKVQEYAKSRLPRQTYHHSMRVFYYASAIIKQQFPEHASGSFSPSTLALACLLHDIGTAEENLSATRMSFEFYGGIKSLNLLLELGAAKDQAEAVCETIIRHQDLGTEGTITFLGQVIQLATIYDNVGEHPNVKDFGKILHRVTREAVNRAFPREGWLGCFAATVRKEIELKPWCHTTHIPDFENKILGNELMKPDE
ncbi:hypothetical protein jhhlp_002914 [Lomentospora prolificans]|uniref:HD domain-containing protein n=1 Tax=Lomentospora prolificans TaxID=41688 RepID=A0A2N3NFE3_9PEZI|nr:hypothetical protein jhhlp_002914 [Lomentospora prolificans]